MHPKTTIIHPKRLELLQTRTVNPEQYRGSTVLFDTLADAFQADRGEYSGVTYGTDRLPQQRQLEEILRELEGAAWTRVFPSGISAISETLMALVRAGDHILVCDNVYGPTARFCTRVLSKFGVTTSFLPPDVGADIIDALRPETRLVFLESPGSNTFEIQDIPAITAVTKSRGIATILDNTWATPLFLDPFSLGVDVSIHSATKYLSGHSDVLMGAVSTTAEYAPILDSFYACREIYAAPEDCQLTLRGLKTLHLRMHAHHASALLVAEWLRQHPLVGSVLHPALPEHPQHHLWKRDFHGASGLFSLTLDHEYPPEILARFIDGLRLFGIGYSWGGYVSLITAGQPRRRFPSPLDGKTIIRLHIGLEDPNDLIADLDQGLRRLSA
ncbi:MAG: cystathionine beta-lyase [Deltaproteobacteria bacterium]|nr:cystathionine beta-lyase [Deltaproteobacteria bacterium]